MNLRLIAIFVSLLAVGASGRFIMDEIPSRQIDGASLAAEQLLGSLRSLPLIRLSQRVEEARNAGNFEEAQALYDLITEITPSNGQIVYRQALNEGRDVASLQRTRDEAWRWVQSALGRLEDARARGVASSEPANAEFLLGFHAGQCFPVEFVEAIATSYRQEDLQRDLAALEKTKPSPALANFLEAHWEIERMNEPPRKAAAFIALPDQDQAYWLRADRLLSRAMIVIAEAGIELPRFQSTTIAAFAVIALHRDDAIRTPAERLAIRERSSAIIARETERLKNEGYPVHAESFYGHALLLQGEAPSSGGPAN